MAYETGTASGHNDLMAKLLTFLSTNPDLVAQGQAWAILRDAELPYTGTAPSRFAFTNRPNSSYPNIAPDQWPANIRSTNVKMKVTGKLVAPVAGSYAFSLRADETCEIRIDGVLRFSRYANNLNIDSFVNSGSVNLSAGEHDIDVRLINISDQGGISLAWRKPGDSAFSIIPAGNFNSLVAQYGVADYASPSANDMAAQMATREVIVRGPGLSDSESIFVMLRSLSSAQLDQYNLYIRFATGYDPSKVGDDQPGVSARPAVCLLWNQEIKYWFVASGRRFIVIAKVSTTYASMYGGFILPYGLPSEYPYPIAAGASAAGDARWSDQSGDHSSFWNPAGANAEPDRSSLYLRRTDGSFDAFKNISPSGGQTYAWTYPYRFLLNYRTSPDGSYALQPVVLYSANGGGNVAGELDGVFSVSGFNNASENTIEIDGKTYLVAQSGFRTTSNDYAAILLE